MDRDEFMELVYETFADEPNNVLANGIIEAADAYVEHEKTQLSQEGATFDTISRQAAIDAIHNLYAIHGSEGSWIDQKDAFKALNSLPPAQPEPQWIPCSERLPEQYGNYLISIHGEDEPDIGTINPNDKRGWSLCDANGFHWASDKKLIVTAWMPLPEPYKGGEKDE